ncbi:MAG TPA: GNAT family N-acetyltransferase [Methylomirabilota bacterium]|nr:GNAT family N-acetyltransferase [Methylomirabilota bacterium]
MPCGKGRGDARLPRPGPGGLGQGPLGWGADAPGKTARLTDGSEVSIRPIRPEDAPALTALYDRLSPHTAYQRFFTVMRRLPPEWARVLANVDYDRRMAFVALTPDDGVIGVARYPSEAGADEAEIAVVVQDGWQGRGLGTRLVTELIEYARGKGIREFRAYVLADNARMLALLGRVATVLDRRTESGIVSLRLGPPAASATVRPPATRRDRPHS